MSDNSQSSCRRHRHPAPSDGGLLCLCMQTNALYASSPAAAAVLQASVLKWQWRALQTSISTCLAALLLQQQGGWQHPWRTSKAAVYWLTGVSWSAAVMYMWLCIGYAAYPLVLGALFGVYWLLYHAGLAARICCGRRDWDAEASEIFMRAAMWLPELPDADQEVGDVHLSMYAGVGRGSPHEC